MTIKNDTDTMKIKAHYLLKTFLLLTFGLPTFTHAATLSSTVNRNQISTNETLTLTVSFDERINSSALDLTPLKRDFNVLGSSPQNRSSVSVVNGQTTQTSSTVWTITLLPKKEGLLTIPSFSISSAKSTAIVINVSNVTQGSGGRSNASLEVMVKASSNKIYPNQQLIVTVELSASSNVRDLNGPQLVIKNAVVEPLDQQNFQRVENGIPRQIVVINYAVFAKQAGELIIPVMSYTGLKNGRRSVFGSSGTQVIARSKQFSIAVSTSPTGTAHPWFPAENVSIESKWSSSPSDLSVGQPVTRTITITAQGQQANVIPPLTNINTQDALKSYKDQPQLETKKSQQGFVAQRIESEAIVISKNGDYVLPSISVHWWNTKSKKWQQSVLPEQTLNVTGATSSNRIEATPLEITPPTSINMLSNNKPHWFWPIITAFLSLVVLIQFHFLQKVRKHKKRVKQQKKDDTSDAAAWVTLQTAFKSDNSRAIRNGITLWAKAISGSGQPTSLTSLAQANDHHKLEHALEKLDQHLYKQGPKVDMKKLNGLIREFRSHILKSEKGAQKERSVLQPLYPQ